MADYFKNEAGDLFVKTPTGDVIPIEADDVARIERGGVGQLAAAAGRGLGEIATGAGTLLGVEGARGQFEEFGRQGDIQQRLRPELALGEFIPDVAAGFATGGGSLLVQAGKTALVEGVLGAVRSPDAPLRGGLTGAVIGAVGGGAVAGLGRLGQVAKPSVARSQVMARSMTQRFNRSAQDVVAGSRSDRSLSAAITGRGAPMHEGERVLGGFADADAVRELAKDFGVEPSRVLTRGDELALGARNADQIEAADALRGREELARSQPLADVAAGAGRQTVSGIRDSQRDLANQVVMRELGEAQGTRMTNANMLRIKDEISDQFEEVADKAGPLRMDRADQNKLDAITEDALTQDVPFIDKTVEAIEADIARSSEKLGASGTLSPEAARSWRTRLNRQMNSAAAADNMGRHQSLSELVDVLDDVVERQIPSDVADDLFEARYKFRIMRAIERSGATRTASGQINMRSFMNNLTKGANVGGKSFRLGTKSERAANRARGAAGMAPEQTKGGKFMANIEALAFLTEKVAPDSGTASRILASLPKGAGLATRGLLE